MTVRHTPGGRKTTATNTQKKYTTAAAQARMIDLLKEGYTINAALDAIDYSRKAYEYWRRENSSFKLAADNAKMLRQVREVKRGERLDFAAWRQKYLRTYTPWHQLQWVDLLEGKPPRDLHPAQTYVKGKRNRILINVPPHHGKSVCLSIDYIVYRLCMDPSYRVILISAGQELAKDFLFGVKQRLTSPDFNDLQAAYAPDGGWESTAESWTESRIVFGTDVRAQGNSEIREKDANVLALGMRSKVYGRRADLILVDDGVDTTNVSDYAKQMKWLSQMVESRLEQGGRLLTIGTRVSPIDLYSELMKPENYTSGVSPWSYFASPAILEEGESPEEHVTLWPTAQSPWVDPKDLDQDLCDCESPECSYGIQLDDDTKVYPRWDGVHLEIVRAGKSAADWALIYQQSSVAEDATFPDYKVSRCVNTVRLPGVLEDDRAGHPFGGMAGKYVIGGCDPAIKGHAGLVVIAVDKASGKRFLLNAWNLKAPTAEELKTKMREVTEHYHVSEWRVEKTGLLQFFTQDAPFRMWFASRGVRFTEHTTGRNKWDAAYGVSSMAPMFGEYDRAWDTPRAEWREVTPALFELPRPMKDGIKALIHQLVTWTPELDPSKIPCDMVMALWFADVGAREFLGHRTGGSGNVAMLGRSNRFVSPRSQRKRTVVNLADLRA